MIQENQEASFKVGKIIEKLGVPPHAMNRSLFVEAEENFPEIFQNSFIFSALLLLWECDIIDNHLENVEKALVIVTRGLLWNGRQAKDVFPDQQLQAMSDAIAEMEIYLTNSN